MLMIQNSDDWTVLKMKEVKVSILVVLTAELGGVPSLSERLRQAAGPYAARWAENTGAL